MADTGDELPIAELRNADDEMVGTGDYTGKPLVLYFYPRADTPGCTKEGVAFTELKPRFDKLGARIVGVSKDTPRKLEKFAAKHELKIDLLSDEDGAFCERMGVWVEKNMYGRKYMGIERATFLVDAEGKIARAWRKVKVKGHADEVLEAVGELVG